MNKKIILISSLAIIATLVWLAVFTIEQNKDLQVIFFDIGQGDAILIQKNNFQVLIDGGPGKQILEKLGKAMPFWDREVELVILTHPDYDHLNGLNYVAQRYKINLVLETDQECSTKTCDKWRSLDLNRKIVQPGQQIKIFQDLIINILNIQESIIAKMLYQDKSILFTGDAGFKQEQELINNNFNLKSDILKIGHHGSKNSTSQKFLEQVVPEIAIISCAKNNKYGHPAPELLERLLGVRVLRTDILGDINLKF